MNSSFIALAASSISFLALGDWGGTGYAPYTTSAQIQTAAGMAKVSKEISANFVVALGDNFYSDGVQKSSSSIRFKDTWENVYLTNHDLDLKWYAIAGNHDHYGDVSIQIAYTNSSEYWTFPSEYHAHSFKGDTFSLDLILIDTVDLAGSTVEEGHPDYFKPLALKSRHLASTQWDWIESQLSSSKADYIIVGGHYPVWSPCEHGPTSSLVSHLKPLLEKYEAHYMAGHDHCISHIQETSSSVNYINSGMGVECCYSPSNVKKVPANSIKYSLSDENKDSQVGGFASIQANVDGMIVNYYDQDGTVLFTPSTIPRRSSRLTL